MGARDRLHRKQGEQEHQCNADGQIAPQVPARRELSEGLPSEESPARFWPLSFSGPVA